MAESTTVTNGLATYERLCKLCGVKIVAPTKNMLVATLNHHIEWDCEVVRIINSLDIECPEFLRQMWEFLQDEAVVKRLAESGKSYSWVSQLSELGKIYKLQTILNAISKLDQENG